MEKVLVTGATGFLGKYLVQMLTEQGYQVYALGRNKKAGEQLEQMGAVFCQGDFSTKDSCKDYFPGMDYVIHAGALSTVWGDWDDFFKSNVLGTENVLELSLENSVKRVVVVSSPSVYSGKEDRFDIKENQVDKSNELNYYIKSKIMAEDIVSSYNKKGLETVIIRPRGLIGIGDTSLIPRILKANGKSGIPLFNKGQNYVDITCVENVSHALILAMKAEGVSGDVFNITNGEPMKFIDILMLFLNSIKTEPKFLKLPFGLIYGIASFLEFFYKTFHIKGEPALTKYTVCTLAFSQTLDISKAREKLGYGPIITLEQGILNYGKWWMENEQN